MVIVEKTGNYITNIRFLTVAIYRYNFKKTPHYPNWTAPCQIDSGNNENLLIFHK